MNLQMFNLTSEQLTCEMNKGKELLMEQLERDGLLKAKAQDINEYYAITLVHDNSLGSAIKKFLKIEDKGRYVVVCVGEREKPELFAELPDDES
jgi:hypothetical protein